MEPELFARFYAQHAASLYSLYQHPQLVPFQNYGPWLLQTASKQQLREHLSTLSECQGVLVSERPLESLAIQLSRGCVILTPDDKAMLVRFYASHALPVLAAEKQSNWHPELFKDIALWWVPGLSGWQQIDITSQHVHLGLPVTVRLNRRAWNAISDSPIIQNVLAEWQKRPEAQGFSSCTQRLLVIKALNKAEEAGMLTSYDRTFYALCYLGGGKALLKERLTHEALGQIRRGEKSLVNLFGY